MPAIMPHVLSRGGEDEEKAEFEKCANGVGRVHKSLLIKAITLVRRKIATFLRGGLYET